MESKSLILQQFGAPRCCCPFQLSFTVKLLYFGSKQVKLPISPVTSSFCNLSCRVTPRDTTQQSALRHLARPDRPCLGLAGAGGLTASKSPRPPAFQWEKTRGRLAARKSVKPRGRCRRFAGVRGPVPGSSNPIVWRSFAPEETPVTHRSKRKEVPLQS